MIGTSSAAADSSPGEPPSARWLAYLQLIRLPNLFTAVADLAMGYLVTHGSLQPAGWFAMLLISSSCLYLAGMVLNDLFDAEVDARYRPERPIPSGRVPREIARLIGYGLWGTGIVAAWMVSAWAGTWRPGIVGTCLGITVWAYDGPLKSTLLGPVAMGACRTWNVLLGMSVAVSAGGGTVRDWSEAELFIAVGLGVYVAGITWFARSEARTSARAGLAGGLALMMLGLALLSAVIGVLPPGRSLLVRQPGWYLLWGVLALLVARRAVLAILEPVPRRVQNAVRNAILALVVIDAGITLGFCGAFWGCAILLLLFPASILGRWIPST